MRSEKVELDGQHDDGDELVKSQVMYDAKKEEVRMQLQDHIEAFLKNGGKIASIDRNVLADPPKKPQSNYGGQPI